MVSTFGRVYFSVYMKNNTRNLAEGCRETLDFSLVFHGLPVVPERHVQNGGQLMDSQLALPNTRVAVC